LSHPFLVFNRSELIYIIVIFILGIIIGATALNIYISQQIDKLIYEKKELENSLQENQKEINKLEKNLAKQKHNFIRTLKITLETELNKHNQQAVKKKLQELLSGIIGKEITLLDPLLLRDIINNRYILIEDNTFQLHLLYMVIQENLELYIKVE